MNEASLKSFYDAGQAARAILRFVEGKALADYKADDLLASAIERKFEIIGEALNRIRKTNPEDLHWIGDWPAIIGFRNLLAHGYDHIEATVVWGIVRDQLPLFLEEVKKVPGLDLEEQ